ncbi:uncharacterized protein LOC143265818 [Megachile rotundata]|uniref:uncharacterized protein LOC143265818 n=1 Tax=Megachile rotundata TaxID=143995 RepID=UPI003FD3C780
MAANILNVQHVEKLNNGNYESWKVQMKFLLRYNDLWGYVTRDIVKTQENSAAWDIRDAIESREVLPTMEELKVKLMEEETRRSNNDEEENKETGLKATDTNKGFSTYSKYNNRSKNAQEKPREFQGNCYNCNRYGHSAKNCYSKSHNRSNDTHKISSETSKRNHTPHWKNNAMAAALNNYHVTATTWILDSCATIHITNDKNKFKYLRSMSTQIYTGTEEAVEASGKGSVQMTVKRDKRNSIEVLLQEGRKRMAHILLRKKSNTLLIELTMYHSTHH